LLASGGEPDDRIVGEWSRQRLLKMDAKFCRAVERAFRTAQQSPHPA
jgi:hypothetical protein